MYTISNGGMDFTFKKVDVSEWDLPKKDNAVQFSFTSEPICFDQRKANVKIFTLVKMKSRSKQSRTVFVRKQVSFKELISLHE